MATSRRSKPPVIHIVLDTNALFTDHADKLLSLELSEFIKKGAQATGNDIFWYLPTVVRQERHVQMLERARALLPSVGKIELLLGHRLGIDETSLAPRVVEAIERNITEHKLKELSLDPQQVDWIKLIENAIYRRPPFSGTKEKGFKDAVVLETFCQFVGSSAKSPQSCRIVLLTGDGPLKEAAEHRVTGSSNCAIIPDLDGLRNYINAIASHLPDEEVTRLVAIADDLFFERDDQSTVWYKIRDSLSKMLDDLAPPGPGPEFKVINVVWSFRRPTFVSKTGQKITFRSTVLKKITAQRTSIIRPAQPRLGDVSGFAATPKTALPTQALGRPDWSSLVDALSPPAVIRYTRKGYHQLTVEWEATLSRRGALTGQKFASAKYELTNWDEEVLEEEKPTG